MITFACCPSYCLLASDVSIALMRTRSPILSKFCSPFPKDTPQESYAIHPSAWKENSANFAITEFSEVRMASVLG